MLYSLTIPGFEGQRIEVQSAGLFSSAKLLVNQQLAPKGTKRGEMLLRRNDGQTVVAQWKSQFLDVPNLVVDGTNFQVVEPLKWYQWAWGGLPVLLLFVGGAIGGLIGAIGFMINAKIFRSELNGVLKYVLVATITLLSVVAYFILGALFVTFMRGMTS